jgi:hypothetical protein
VLFQENPECRKHFSDNTFLKGATLEEGGLVLNPQPLTQALTGRSAHLKTPAILSSTDSLGHKAYKDKKASIYDKTAAKDRQESTSNIASTGNKAHQSSMSAASSYQIETEDEIVTLQHPGDIESPGISTPTKKDATATTKLQVTVGNTVPFGSQTFQKDLERTEKTAVNTSNLLILLEGKMALADHVVTADHVVSSKHVESPAEHVVSATQVSAADHVLSAKQVSVADRLVPAGHVATADQLMPADNVSLANKMAQSEQLAPSGQIVKSASREKSNIVNKNLHSISKSINSETLRS